ncbi:MAG TPA: DUF1343 domain-containing protein [Ignavibacteria bacterium]|nr:DUF1343 domain-containing protein [Ignavibacteria bacterium]
MILNTIFLTAVIFFSGVFHKPDVIQKVKIEDQFILGNENLLKNKSEVLSGKNTALITNKSGVMSDGTLFLDELVKNANVRKIFTPEHGLRGDDRDENFTDENTGLPVISLYGNNKMPAKTDLEDIDVLVYDIQDVGARFYTFINTMFYCMQAANENNIEFVVCDRPMMPNGNYVDGFMLDDGQESFVGMIDIPIAYGMTCGELALYINTEYFGDACKLKVIKMENYSRETDYQSLNLPWVKPSPNIYYPSSALTYLGTCLFEGTNFSEGRGTDKPFEYVGAPYCDGNALAEEMNSLGLNGVTFESIDFVPTTITSPSNPPKYVGENCSGVYIKVTDKNSFEPVKTGIAFLVSLNKLFSGFEIKTNKFLDKLAGTDRLRLAVLNGYTTNEIVSGYQQELQDFKELRKKYLIYK